MLDLALLGLSPAMSRNEGTRVVYRVRADGGSRSQLSTVLDRANIDSEDRVEVRRKTGRDVEKRDYYSDEDEVQHRGSKGKAGETRTIYSVRDREVEGMRTVESTPGRQSRDTSASLSNDTQTRHRDAAKAQSRRDNIGYEADESSVQLRERRDSATPRARMQTQKIYDRDDYDYDYNGIEIERLARREDGRGYVIPVNGNTRDYEVLIGEDARTYRDRTTGDSVRNPRRSGAGYMALEQRREDAKSREQPQDETWMSGARSPTKTANGDARTHKNTDQREGRRGQAMQRDRRVSRTEDGYQSSVLTEKAVNRLNRDTRNSPQHRQGSEAREPAPSSNSDHDDSKDSKQKRIERTSDKDIFIINQSSDSKRNPARPALRSALKSSQSKSSDREYAFLQQTRNSNDTANGDANSHGRDRLRSRSIIFRDSDVEGHMVGERFHETPGREAARYGRYLMHYDYNRDDDDLDDWKMKRNTEKRRSRSRNKSEGKSGDSDGETGISRYNHEYRDIIRADPDPDPDRLKTKTKRNDARREEEEKESASDDQSYISRTVTREKRTTYY